MKKKSADLVVDLPRDRPSMAWQISTVGGAAADGGWNKRKKLSMQETTREAKWEKRQRMLLAVEEQEEQQAEEVEEGRKVRSLTDEDLDELKGCIELGFGFSEEGGGHDLRHTLPALDLYFAVNRLRNYSLSSGSTSSASTPTTLSPRSADGSSTSGESWKICNPGDDPQLVKTRLRHWAQAVACSLRQSC
ncbi:uncharacterized protein LOC121981700 isoform X1 [Zingiber officinale]|uniref:Uncharacterized protein n=1 Tax=Zingiber officinale TaxID=94328 RepID=A0A8J5GPH4_ZINOF|nr:uncharacterized protein LOC121981700 isoform X1 [Zingiber officinale]KAG6508270.1 hypothetical protein ZIOFF_033644 [Zingiber officinale]